MQPLEIIQSDKDSDFTGALAQNAGADANLTGLLANDVMIRDVVVLSDQQLAWEIQLYSADTFDNADADLDTYLGSIRFAESDGLQVADTGLFKYDVHGLALRYRDDDGSNELHIKLVNRSSTSKNAGATGEVVVKIGHEAGQWG